MPLTAQTNPLIEQLQAAGELNTAALKKLYRALCKETHPDVVPGRESEFLELRRHYEEAILILQSPGNPATRQSIEEEADLEELLSLFAVRGLARENGPVIERLIVLLQVENPVAAAHWREYRQRWFDTLPAWQERGVIFYTHGLFLAAVRQYVLWLDKPTPRNRELLAGLVKDLGVKVVSRRVENGAVLTALAGWILELCG